MFNYTHPVVINNVEDAKLLGALGKVVIDSAAGTAALTINPDVTAFAAYDAGSAGQCGEYDLAALATGADALVVNRAMIKLVSPNAQLSDFGVANWQEFAKGIMVEVSKANGEDALDNLKASLKTLANELIEVKDTTIKIKDARVKAIITTEKLTFASAEDANPVVEATADIAASVEPKEGLYDYEYMAANVQFPTYYNLRNNRVGGSKIVEGAVYDCYTYTVKANRPGLGGLSAVGQDIKSVTNVVIYLNQALNGKITGLAKDGDLSTATTAADIKGVVDALNTAINA